MSSPALPSCPRCGRRIAAWKMEHCVYCGAAFPEGFKANWPEPQSLQWVNRPDIPAGAAKQLELMKITPGDRQKNSSAIRILTFLSLPVFAGLFLLLHSLARRAIDRYLPGASVLVLIAGAFFLAYLIWTLWKTPRR